MSTTTRPSWDEYFMNMCDVVATRATCDRKHVGAVITKSNRVLSVGFNGSLPGTVHCNERKCVACGWKEDYPEIPLNKTLKNSKCPNCGNNGGFLETVKGGHLIENGHCIRVCHAEENAIVYAARTGIALEGASIYCNTVPCWNCMKLTVGAGIVEVVYKDDYDISGNEAIEDFLDQLTWMLPHPFKLRQLKMK